MGNFNDVLLERLADQGDGFYAYVDDIDEARRVFRRDRGQLQARRGRRRGCRGFRGSAWGSTYRLRDVLAVADELSAELPRNNEVGGFLELLARAAALER